MNIIKKAISELKEAVYNPRKKLTEEDAEYQKLKRSIEKFGYVEPIIINKRSGNIVGGHQRLTVLKDLGYEEINVVEVDLSDEEEKALNIALNKISGEWDIPKLKDLLEELDTGAIDIELTGFELEELENLFTQTHVGDTEIVDDEIDPDEELAKIDVPQTKRGDIYELGSHRLICGDATDPATYSLLLEGRKADCIVADPPYGVSYTGKTKDALTLQNDKLTGESLEQFLREIFLNLLGHAQDGCPIYVFHADWYGHIFRLALLTAGWKFAQTCVWVKNNFVMGRQDFHWRHEPILYGWKATAKHRWYSDRKQDTVWEFDRPQRNAEHPTMKPVPLLAYPLQLSSRTRDIILDPCAGSGSIMIAAEQLDRRAYMIEIDEKYCDVIVARYEKFTGQKAVKIRSGDASE